MEENKDTMKSIGIINKVRERQIEIFINWSQPLWCRLLPSDPSVPSFPFSLPPLTLARSLAHSLFLYLTEFVATCLTCKHALTSTRSLYVLWLILQWKERCLCALISMLAGCLRVYLTAYLCLHRWAVWCRAPRSRWWPWPCGFCSISPTIWWVNEYWVFAGHACVRVSSTELFTLRPLSFMFALADRLPRAKRSRFHHHAWQLA